MHSQKSHHQVGCDIMLFARCPKPPKKTPLRWNIWGGAEIRMHDPLSGYLLVNLKQAVVLTRLFPRAPDVDRWQICESAQAGGQMKVRSHTTPNKFIFTERRRHWWSFLSSVTEWDVFDGTKPAWTLNLGPDGSSALQFCLANRFHVEQVLWSKPSDAVIYSHTVVCIKVLVLFHRIIAGEESLGCP